jgi:hypothetical protein
MSPSPRPFRKEFMEGGLRRFDMWASITDVAPVCETNPNVLRRWHVIQLICEKWFPNQ